MGLCAYLGIVIHSVIRLLHRVTPWCFSRAGFFVTREYEYMLGQDMRELYIDLLTRKEAPVKMRCQVLRNMLMYLMEEEARMIKADQECKFIIIITLLLHIYIMYM